MPNIGTGEQISMISEPGVTRGAKSGWRYRTCGERGNRGGDERWSKEEKEGRDERTADAQAEFGSRRRTQGSRLRPTASRGRSSSFINRTIRSLPSRGFVLSLDRILGIGSLILGLTVPIIINRIIPLRSGSSRRRGLSTRSSRCPLLRPPTSLQNLLPVPNRPLILHLLTIKQLVLAERANPFVRRVRQRRWWGSRISFPVSFSPRWKMG